MLVQPLRAAQLNTAPPGANVSVPDLQSKAQALYRARATRKPIAPFTDLEPTLGMADGYAIQQELVTMLLADGDRVIGYKAGLTSAPMQRMFAVDTPDYGPVLASTLYANGDTISLDRFITPKVEAEIVFRLGSRLAGPGVDYDQARMAITEAIAGLEIVDSRVEDWRVMLADTIADLASNGALVLADHAVPVAELDPRLVGMVFTRNGELEATGAGAAALGDPVAVVAWLANTLGEHGVALEAGHLIMTGALHAAVPMNPGDEFTAEFDRLGSVTVRAGAEA
jgi:2-keto-4-pentenoate hydratase